MNKKPITLVGIVITILVVGIAAFLYLDARNKEQQKKNAEQASEVSATAAAKAVFEADKDTQVTYAKSLYEQAKTAGYSFASGPCLSNGKDWVVDVVHNPRQPVDDDPTYQCASFVSGVAKHFVELDVDGNLVRAE